MEIRSTEEARKNIESFSERYLNLLEQKKVIDTDIKALKDEFKEEGVPVAVVAKAINRIKTEKKQKDSELFELEKIMDWLRANAGIDDTIGKLNAPS